MSSRLCHHEPDDHESHDLQDGNHCVKCGLVKGYGRLMPGHPVPCPKDIHIRKVPYKPAFRYRKYNPEDPSTRITNTEALDSYFKYKKYPFYIRIRLWLGI